MAELTFPTPAGFQPPENLDSDNTFQAMATFKLVGDGGELELVDIEGYQLAEEGDEEAQMMQQTEAANAQAALQGGGSAASVDQEGPPAGTQASLAQQMGQKFRRATGRR